MSISACQNFFGAISLLCIKRGEIDHCPDAEGGTFGGVKRFGGAEKFSGHLLALSDNPFAIAVVKHIRTVDFRNIQGFRTEKAFPFVAGHMQT